MNAPSPPAPRQTRLLAGHSPCRSVWGVMQKPQQRLPARQPRVVRRASGPGSMAGLTLVEMLVALSLLSVLLLTLTGALRAAAQTQERVDARVQAAQDYRLTALFLQDILSQASSEAFTPAGHAQRLPDAQSWWTLFFRGEPDALQWIGPLPARYGLGGRHYMRLALEPVTRASDPNAPAGSALVLRYLPWTPTPASATLPWHSADAQVLAQGVSALALRYQHPATGVWTAQWPPPGPRLRGGVRLPSAVSVSVEGPQPAWPLMAATLHTPIASDRIALSTGFGPGPD